MLQVIEKVNHFIQPILWGWPVLICILLAGILFTVRLRFFQFTKIGLWMKLTFAGMFRRKNFPYMKGNFHPIHFHPEQPYL